MQTVIHITPDTIRTVYFDGLAECFIDSPMEIRRASTVEFNAHSQQWEVRFTEQPDQVVFTHPSRGECIKWEVSELNRRFTEQ